MRKDRVIFSDPVKNINKELRESDIVLCLGEMYPSRKLWFSSYITGYQLAIDSIYKTNASRICSVSDNDKMAYPFIFLCRQVVELYLKWFLALLGDEYKKSHMLAEQMALLVNKLKTVVNDKDLSDLLDNLSRYVCLLEKVDERSTRLRYPEDKNEKPSFNVYPKRESIDISAIYEYQCQFVKQMKSIEEEMVERGIIDYKRMVCWSSIAQEANEYD